MSTGAVDLGLLPVAGTKRLRATIKKDGAAWTGIDSVQLTLEGPDRSTQTAHAMVMETPDAGVWYYDTVAADINAEGYWTLTLQVTDGTVVLKYPHEIGFLAVGQP